MRAKVPEEMKEQVLRQLKHLRFCYCAKLFPLAWAGFWGVCILVLLIRGHVLLYLLKQFTSLSEKEIIFLCSVLIGVFSFGLMFYVIRAIYRQLALEEHFYCHNCDAVDADDEGCCPICSTSLQDRATFICTYESKEIKLLKKLGLEFCKEK